MAAICARLVILNNYVEVYCILLLRTQIFLGTGIPTAVICVQPVGLSKFVEVYCIMQFWTQKS